MRKSTVVALLALALVTPAVNAADVTEADFQKAMKEVQAGVQAVNKAMRETPTDLSAVVAGAKSIDAALAITEGYWTAHKVQDAIEMTAKGRAAAKAVATAAGTNDAAATKEAMNGVFASCKGCHEVHREKLPDNTYKIK